MPAVVANVNVFCPYVARVRVEQPTVSVQLAVAAGVGEIGGRGGTVGLRGRGGGRRRRRGRRGGRKGEAINTDIAYVFGFLYRVDKLDRLPERVRLCVSMCYSSIRSKPVPSWLEGSGIIPAYYIRSN